MCHLNEVQKGQKISFNWSPNKSTMFRLIAWFHNLFPNLIGMSHILTKMFDYLIVRMSVHLESNLQSDLREGQACLRAHQLAPVQFNLGYKSHFHVKWDFWLMSHWIHQFVWSFIVMIACAFMLVPTFPLFTSSERNLIVTHKDLLQDKI